MMRQRAVSALRAFLQNEASGGLLLIALSALALMLANGPAQLAYLYSHVLHMEVGPLLSDKLGPMTAHLWINDGLMAIFFLTVGLEIKREWVDGRLASWEHRRLPVIAAASGMLVPALVYAFMIGDQSHLLRGWAIPAATDIAFALGVLALLGKRAPTSLKLLLLTIAIVDDMGAVAVIAIAYTQDINLLALGAAAMIWALMLAINRAGVRHLGIYMLLAALLWYATLLSGVHATIAGVLAAFAIPVIATPGAPDAADSPLHRLEHRLHPWSAYLIVPVFGFANAGVQLGGASAQASVLAVAVAAGLFVGKQAGIFASIWLCARFGIAAPPRGATWVQVYGLALLCGIGFTMSLFIAGLAFPGELVLMDGARIGILAGSLLSALAGFAVLRFASLHPDHDRVENAQAQEIAADGDVLS